LASLHELLFVRKTDGKEPKRKREKFSPDTNNTPQQGTPIPTARNTDSHSRERQFPQQGTADAT